ncbi:MULTISPECIES: hypothetical protein [unclassified Staphylococcus]|uniref:hypothetical protein n=1 Tax=unclassified Staphylococcus TaxID=91994 RepID=UPI0021CFE56F|nr:MULTISPECIES: hypothetical protein [unclassified Staphylococcus]UXR79124.1 hypothetical protein MUA92_04330 [Staphylococcus sp. IVB6227]UXR81779.1 hypothetical protein MUA51_06695 [Staphylococcus sp. IVB6214]
MEKKNKTVNAINQKRHAEYKQTNNMDFALSFIAGTLIGSAVGYAIKPFVNHAIDYTQEHELTNLDKQSQKIREEALRKADEIKEKAQQIKNQALSKKTEGPTTQQLEAQQRAIKEEIDSDKLEAPTVDTYHFGAKKDKPVDLAQLKSRQNAMTTNTAVSEVTKKETEKAEKAEPKAKEEVSVSSLAAMRQAMAVDTPAKVEEKAEKTEPKAKEEVSVSSLAAMRQAMAVDTPAKVEEKAEKTEPKAKEEVSVSSLAAMRQVMAVDKPAKIEEKTEKVEPKKTAQSKKNSQPKGNNDVVQRNKQTHREARFENGVITHEAAPKPKKQTKNTPKKRTSNAKKPKTNKAKTQKRNSKVEKHTFKN